LTVDAEMGSGFALAMVCDGGEMAAPSVLDFSAVRTASAISSALRWYVNPSEPKVAISGLSGRILVAWLITARSIFDARDCRQIGSLSLLLG
jgi:hypothetical protein